MPLKQLKTTDVKEIISKAAERSKIKLPEEYSFGDARGPEWDAWEAISKNIEELMESLSDGAIIELQALMWLGRGDSGDDFDALVKHAQGTHSPGTIRYITSKSSLSEYLTEGSKKLGIAI